ncbi:MarR family winged helix-turn-helix transcriptional regulator [Streptomyces albireticuli]|uniref:MarR family transcriptional regulator n=1 Tax=Streptomyces albireticuli TaxID=1940 RepID=A0A2A2DB97_9ACTN|nr:MarR family transcriptional regulator [Streptomyces albireticuli]MCD9143993.1 MarR family transcriptional regulator [Streptomyces albireticuli]MCD9161576.1 MarR family transcriptional regulator [Streptomyces albireticuli]MCD9192110.1 MarR family transcriptional regulator [Streptomyces albireticuli]PAU49763.1 MarR family transcriptional regulator [Streptomyces albireticuli]
MSATHDTVSHALARVARLHRIAAGQLLRRLGLHPGQELLMMHLWDHGPQPQAQLIDLLGLDASTVTRMVQRLEQAGFVRRQRSDTDRRAVLVEPTAAAQALQEQVVQAWQQLEELTLHGLDDSERAAVSRLLGRIEGNLGPAASGS